MYLYPKLIIRTPIFPFSGPFSESVFEEALYISSPSLYKEYIKQKTEKKDNEQTLHKMDFTIYKYLSRARTRCTPFGLFAGVSVGSFNIKNDVRFSKNLSKTYDRKTRLDMGVLGLLYQSLLHKPSVFKFLKFYPNNSLYKVGDFYRYVEYSYSAGKRKYTITKVDASKYLDLVLKGASTGSRLEDLVNILNIDDIKQHEADEFIGDLVSSQILSSEIEPTITGADYFCIIIRKLRDIYELNPDNELKIILYNLIEIQKQIQDLDKIKTPKIESYKLIYNQLKEILPDLSETNLLQVDLLRKLKTNSLSNNIEKAVLDAANFLNKISPKTENKNLIDFQKRFLERYEEDEMPLLKVLDSESGIGYPGQDSNGINHLVDDLHILQTTSLNTITWNETQKILHQLYLEALKEDKTCIELKDEVFKNVNNTTDLLPHTMSVRFKVINEKQGTIILESLTGVSAMNLLGRFTYLDNDLLKIANDISSFEKKQNVNSILAEIVHLPEDRVGNVLCRPIFRDFEIPYLSKSNLLDEFQINLNDLYISVKGNKVYLRSKKLNKEVIPRLGNAHNYSANSLPVYHFLCDLQSQYYEKTALSFNWGNLLSDQKFLPRIIYKGVVLSLAKWQLTENEINEITKKTKLNDKLTCICRLQKEHKIPQLFVMKDGDNDLLINLNEEKAILTFIDTIKSKKKVIIEEFLFLDEHSLIKNSEGDCFTNECIAIIFNENNKVDFEINKREKKSTTSKKNFSIGSEWIYFKIYSGVKIGDYILTQKLKPLLEQLVYNKCIDKWFFIRYADPETHLRIRLHVLDYNEYYKILSDINLLLDGLMGDDLLFKTQFDTYKRELNRYGDSNIENTESLFFYDSKCCAEILCHLADFNNDSFRWKIAIKSIDCFLDDFRFSVNEKFKLMENLSEHFFKEYGGDKQLKIQLDLKYRKLKESISKILTENSNDESVNYLFSIITNRSKENELCVEKIYDDMNNNRLEVDFNNLISSYIHMILNRLFISKQRQNEMVIYDFLKRHYKSDILYKKKNVPL